MSKSRPSPLSIRFSDAARARLLEKAGGLPLGTYIKQVVLGDAPARRMPSTPIKDKKALAALLGALGKSHLSNNLNQLAKAANIGALPVTPDLEADLKAACADIHLMRGLLLQALGIGLPSKPAPLTSIFTRAAK